MLWFISLHVNKISVDSFDSDGTIEITSSLLQPTQKKKKKNPLQKQGVWEWVER